VSILARRERENYGDLWDWLDFPAFPMMRPATGTQTIRLEDYLENDQYVLRAELPGIDPDKDVDITVEEGVLRVSAERREEKKEGRRSEFRYGTLMRSVTLPAGADEEGVQASYRNGILEVRVPLKKPVSETKHITITKG